MTNGWKRDCFPMQTSTSGGCRDTEENEVTVKRYRQEGSIAWLLPENEAFEPIKVDLKEHDLLIEGIVVGVVRQGKGLGL